MTAPVRAYAVRSDGPPFLHELPGVGDARGPHEAFERLGLDGGVYTGFRSDDGRFLGLEEHLERTRRSMRLLSWADAETRLDETALRRGLVEALERAAAERPDGPRDSMFRVDVLPPGETVPGTTAHVALAVGPLHPVPPEFLAEGVGVQIAEELERHRPRIKTSSFVLDRRPYPLGTRDAYEHVLLDAEGRVLEGTSANLFCVRGGRVVTADEGVLEGITRRLLLEIMEREGMRVVLEAPTLDEFVGAEEAFLTSSTRGVVPIVAVAGQPVGGGRPGPLTARLAELLSRSWNERARPAWPPPDHEGGAAGKRPARGASEADPRSLGGVPDPSPR